MKLTTSDSNMAVISKKTSAVVEFVKKTSKNNRKKTIAIVAALLLVISYIAYKSTQQPKTPGGQSTAEAVVTRGPIEVTVTGTGTLSALAREDIASKVNGTVKKVYVKNGDSVKKGDLLFEMDSSTLNLEVGKAQLDVEKAKLSLSDSALSADTILAPFYGKIISLDVKTDEEVSKNTVLATLLDDSQLVFDMPVNSAIAQKAVINQKVDVFLPDRGDLVEGKVLAKDSEPLSGYNNESRTNLKIGVATKGNLTSGMKAFGSIVIDGREEDALSVSTMEWLGETQIKATLTGNLDGVYVKEGQVVKKGQRLFALSNDSTVSQQKTEQLNYQQAQLNLANLETQLNDLAVKASIDGIVSDMDLTEGDEVSLSSGSKSNQNSTESTASDAFSLGKIINSKQMNISFPVDEVDIAKVKLDQQAEVTVDALPEKVFRGKVTEIAEEGVVTNNVSSFEVTILLDNGEDALKSGMTANVTIIAAKRDNAMLIPIEALQDMGRRKFVLLPPTGDSQEAAAGFRRNSGDPQNSGDAQQRQNRRPVTVGLTNESFAEITEGLKEGDKVLLPGLQTNTNNANAVRFPGMGGGGSRNSSGGGNARPAGGGAVRFAR